MAAEGRVEVGGSQCSNSRVRKEMGGRCEAGVLALTGLTVCNESVWFMAVLLSLGLS